MANKQRIYFLLARLFAILVCRPVFDPGRWIPSFIYYWLALLSISTMSNQKPEIRLFTHLYERSSPRPGALITKKYRFGYFWVAESTTSHNKLSQLHLPFPPPFLKHHEVLLTVTGPCVLGSRVQVFLFKSLRLSLANVRYGVAECWFGDWR